MAGCTADQGITVCVKADWTACSPRRIQLAFREAGASRLRISDAFEALLAPALLPRTWLTQQVLLALREVGSCLASLHCLVCATSACVLACLILDPPSHGSRGAGMRLAHATQGALLNLNAAVLRVHSQGCCPPPVQSCH